MTQYPQDPQNQPPYGQPPAGHVPYGGGPGGQPGQPSSGLAVTSMVLGIVSLPACICWPLAVVLAIAAIVLGVMAKNKIKAGQASGNGMATAGIICGAVALVLIAISLIIAFSNPELMEQYRFQMNQPAE